MHADVCRIQAGCFSSSILRDNPHAWVRIVGNESRLRFFFELGIQSTIMVTPECPRLQQCAFFNDRLRNMPVIAEMTKNSYCRSVSYETCARYLVAQALGTARVPDDLYPNQPDRVDAILKSES